MGTKFDNLKFAVRKILGKSETANTVHAEMVARIREDQLTLGYSPDLMSALTTSACEEAVGVVSNDSDPLRDKLPPKVGEHKAIGWGVRAQEGESVEEITQGTHSTSATVQQAVDAATPYIFGESEATSE